MDRKEFIKTCGWACVGSIVISPFLQGCSTSNYFATTNTIQNKIILKKSEFLIQDKESVTKRKYVLIKNEKFNFPICVFQLNEIQYSAILMECTHLGCELQNQGDFVVCPCHGSEFSNLGVVQNPPAEQNLKSFKTTTDNENIYIEV